ncbi:hypothetical protein JXB01_00765 [Candidatus Micrarchaeota archaeon]|nr:hypothetical protein [Candidatus Micrarchaeota archaeon]
MNTNQGPKVGVENEFFLIDGEGNLSSRADEVLDEMRKNNYEVSEEFSKSQVEMASNPDRNFDAMASDMLGKIRMLSETAEKMGLLILPLGTYPSKSKITVREKEWYQLQRYVLREMFELHGQTCGYHFHYTLPRGLVDKKSQKIKPVRKSRHKDVFINQYNFLVSSDPACITFCQSSPFMDGRYIGKDSRVLIYRDMIMEEKKIHGMYYEYPEFGSLSDYQFTLEDVKNMAIKRKNRYLTLLQMHGKKINEIMNIPELKFTWGPLRVNKIGTFEYRGMDMCHPLQNFSTSVLLKTALDKIGELELQMEPSDIGVEEPFSREGDTVYLPPFSTVKNLEYLSAVYGMENSSVYEYCKKFFEFVLEISGGGKNGFAGVQRIIDSKKTVSDEIIELAAKNGQDKNSISEEFLRYLALYHAKKLKNELPEYIEQYSR